MPTQPTCVRPSVASGGTPLGLSTQLLSRVFQPGTWGLLIMLGHLPASPRDPPASASPAQGLQAEFKTLGCVCLPVYLFLFVLMGILKAELSSSWLQGKHLAYCTVYTVQGETFVEDAVKDAWVENTSLACFRSGLL